MVEKSVFLFKTEPRLGILGFVENLLGVMAVISPVGSAIVVVGFGKNKDVVTTTERVLENSGRTEIDIRITTRGLIGGRTIKVPYTELADVSHLLADGLDIKISKHRERHGEELDTQWFWNGDRHCHQPKHLEQRDETLRGCTK